MNLFNHSIFDDDPVLDPTNANLERCCAPMDKVIFRVSFRWVFASAF